MEPPGWASKEYKVWEGDPSQDSSVGSIRCSCNDIYLSSVRAYAIRAWASAVEKTFKNFFGQKFRTYDGWINASATLFEHTTCI